MSDPLAGVIERLYREFPAVPLTELIELVRGCRDDIDTGASPGCIAELVERLARARLADRAPDTGGSPAARPQSGAAPAVRSEASGTDPEGGSTDGRSAG